MHAFWGRDLYLYPTATFRNVWYAVRPITDLFMKCFCEFHVTEDVTYCPSENPERNLCYAQVQSYNINLLRTTQPSLFVAVTHHVFYLLNYCILEYEADAMNLGSYLKAILSSSSFPFVTSFPFFSIFSYRPRYLPSQNTSSMFTGFC